MNNADLLRPALQNVRELRQTSTLLAKVDQFRPQEALLLAAIGELDEVAEAYSSDDPPEKISDEIRDTLVYSLSWYLRVVGSPELPNTIVSVNGYGNHSGAIESTQAQLQELAENPNARRQMKDFYRIIAQLCSIALHSPEGEKVFTHFYLTTDKVRRNYPPEIFNTLDSLTEQEVGDEDVIPFFESRYRDMRTIRKVRTRGERPLTEQDWRPHYREIIVWQKSDTEQSRFEQAVMARVDEVRESGIAVAGPDTTRKVESGTLRRETVVYQAGRRELLPQ